MKHEYVLRDQNKDTERADARVLQNPQKWAWNVSEPVVIAGTPSPVFISYARENAELAEKISEALRQRGQKTWMDDVGIRSGDDWLERIAKTIDGSKAVVTIISPEAVESKWVRREIEYADNKGKPILPVMIAPCELPGWFELRLGNIQRLDFACGLRDDSPDLLFDSLKKLVVSQRS